MVLKRLFGKREPLDVQVVSHDLRFKAKPGQTLLEAAQDAGVGFPCDCKVGTCGTCRYRLLDGRIAELNSSAVCLSGEDFQNGWRLGCQSVARSDLSIFLPGLVSEIGPPPTLFEAEIASVKPLTHDIVELRLKLNRPIVFVAGQYADLQTEDVEGARSYSFAEAAPPGGSDQPCFHVRRVTGGAFTEWLFGENRVGYGITLRGPLGQFRLRNVDAPIICVGGGTGLAPLKCLLEQAARDNCARPVTLLYGARTQADLYCRDEIVRIAQHWPMPFEFVPVLSMEPEGSDWRGARGLVGDKLAEVPRLAESQIYLCGPPPMVDAAELIALGHGVSKEAILADRFFDRGRTAAGSSVLCQSN